MDTKDFIDQTYNYIWSFFEGVNNRFQERGYKFQNESEMHELSRMISMLNYFQSLRERILLEDKVKYIALLYEKEWLLFKKLESMIKQCQEINSIQELRDANKRFLVDFWFEKNEG